MKNQPFSNWVKRLWQEHLSELEAEGLGLPKYKFQDYFNKHKWWLRREYRFQNIKKS
jgi:hypothetical protein